MSEESFAINCEPDQIIHSEIMRSNVSLNKRNVASHSFFCPYYFLLDISKTMQSNVLLTKINKVNFTSTHGTF
jgi:hypothetical protein